MNHAELLALVSALVDAATWEVFPSDDIRRHDPTATAHQGKSAGWTFLVVSYAIPKSGQMPSGLPFGRDTSQDEARGYDGTATCVSRSLVMRLPRELAERCHALATRAP